jgi:transposase
MFLQDNEMNVFETPPESPDLNAIENVWHELKNFIRTVAKPTCKDELLAAIQDFWATMTIDKCCRYINHLKKVMSKVIEVNREATGY